MLNRYIAEHLVWASVPERPRAPARVQGERRDRHALQVQSIRLMHDSPQQLRRQAEHCRSLASGLSDQRSRLILNGMAQEYDDEARELTRRMSAAGAP